MIVVINYGSQVAHLIARRVRDFNVYSEILSYNVSLDKIKEMNPEGIILSGGPSSVYDQDSPISNKELLNLGIPILGICYGHQLISHQLGGKVTPHDIKEYGKKILEIKNKSTLFENLKDKEQIWMSHGDLVEEPPPGFTTIASTDTCKHAAMANNQKNIYGVQFHPEVVHTLSGNKILENFVFNICKAKKDFIIKDLPKKIISEIREIVGDNSVILGISGGVDSTVTATLINKAIGKKLHAVYIDTGLMRKNETQEIKEKYDKLGLNVEYVNASKDFLEKLKGVTDPEEKRKIIGHTFIDVFDKKAEEFSKKYTDIKFLAMGTIYPDRIESAQPNKQADKIKSHHNLTLPENMKLKVIEPIKEFYKDGVRKLGEELGVPKEVLYRHPFPGPGLAIRILGEVTEERLNILKEADHIFINELKANNLYDKTWQTLAALLPVKSVGVMGDARTYEYIISLRAVTSKDAMTADWAKLPDSFLEKVSNRIINEVKGVNRVVYDITQKPPGTIEYE
ncbi:glutamine-hydrolyzing GMP synthase [Candidatus Woesearchaeota archaeon]|nr:glutamine-hydrolyzing GMP synthase [Candidatus Woesearchaeota archaeon]